jgi:hypothetical protein
MFSMLQLVWNVEEGFIDFGNGTSFPDLYAAIWASTCTIPDLDVSKVKIEGVELAAASVLYRRGDLLTQ